MHEASGADSRVQTSELQAGDLSSIVAQSLPRSVVYYPGNVELWYMLDPFERIEEGNNSNNKRK